MLIRLLRERLPAYKPWLVAVVVLQFLSVLAMLYLPSLNAQIIDEGVAVGDTGVIVRLGLVMLAVSLVGMGQVSARFLLTERGTIDQADAASLVAGLAWRGIGGYPRTDEHR